TSELKVPRPSSFRRGSRSELGKERQQVVACQPEETPAQARSDGGGREGRRRQSTLCPDPFAGLGAGSILEPPVRILHHHAMERLPNAVDSGFGVCKGRRFRRTGFPGRFVAWGL